jgi:hypothetical protein
LTTKKGEKVSPVIETIKKGVFRNLDDYKMVVRNSTPKESPPPNSNPGYGLVEEDGKDLMEVGERIEN